MTSLTDEIRENVEALEEATATALATLRRLIGPGKPGHPHLLHYYHSGNDCECPDVCAHCLLVAEGRSALEVIDAHTHDPPPTAAGAIHQHLDAISNPNPDQ